MTKSNTSLMIICMMAVIFPAPVFAVENTNYKPMTQEALRAVFSDTMMVGEYRNFRDETKTYNYTEYHFKKGTTKYIEGGQREKGVWKIIGGDKICYKYPRSDYYTGTHCFFVYEKDKCYYKYSPNGMTLKGPKSWDRWVSRAIRKGSGGSCSEPLS